MPLYVSSGALLTGAPSSLGMGDAFAALTGGTALSVPPPNAASVPPLGQPLEAFRWREPLISDGCTPVFGAAQESQGRTPAEMGGIFGDVTVLASAPPELPAEVPAQHESRTPGLHATTLPDQSSAALGSSPAGLGDQGGLPPVSPGSGPPQVAEAASQNANLQEEAREHATSRVETAAAPLDGAVSAGGVLCLDNSKQGVVSGREHMIVAALDMVEPIQQQHAEALPEVPCDHASSPALYNVHPVLGLAVGAAKKGVDSSAAHLTPGSAELPGVPASAGARAPSPQLAEPRNSVRYSEGTPLHDVLLPALGSQPAQVPTPALGQAALPASVQAQPAGEVAKDAPRVESAGEACRMLPESKAGQKRARQAAAAQQAKPQLPAKRSWEEWLQPGARLAFLIIYLITGRSETVV